MSNITNLVNNLQRVGSNHITLGDDNNSLSVTTNSWLDRTVSWFNGGNHEQVQKNINTLQFLKNKVNDNLGEEYSKIFSKKMAETFASTRPINADKVAIALKEIVNIKDAEDAMKRENRKINNKNLINLFFDESDAYSNNSTRVLIEAEKKFGLTDDDLGEDFKEIIKKIMFEFGEEQAISLNNSLSAENVLDIFETIFNQILGDMANEIRQAALANADPSIQVSFQENLQNFGFAVNISQELIKKFEEKVSQNLYDLTINVEVPIKANNELVQNALKIELDNLSLSLQIIKDSNLPKNLKNSLAQATLNQFDIIKPEDTKILKSLLSNGANELIKTLFSRNHATLKLSCKAELVELLEKMHELGGKENLNIDREKMLKNILLNACLDLDKEDNYFELNNFGIFSRTLYDIRLEHSMLNQENPEDKQRLEKLEQADEFLMTLFSKVENKNPKLVECVQDNTLINMLFYDEFIEIHKNNGSEIQNLITLINEETKKNFITQMNDELKTFQFTVIDEDDSRTLEKLKKDIIDNNFDEQTYLSTTETIENAKLFLQNYSLGSLDYSEIKAFIDNVDEFKNNSFTGHVNYSSAVLAKNILEEKMKSQLWKAESQFSLQFVKDFYRGMAFVVNGKIIPKPNDESDIQGKLSSLKFLVEQFDNDPKLAGNILKKINQGIIGCCTSVFVENPDKFPYEQVYSAVKGVVNQNMKCEINKNNDDSYNIIIQNTYAKSSACYIKLNLILSDVKNPDPNLTLVDSTVGFILRDDPSVE